jgi:hypothetical protein
MTLDRCEHGAIRNEPWPGDFGWMEATGECGCCGTVFTCWYGHVPANRCKTCGGREKTYEEARAEIGEEPHPEPPKTLAERLNDYKQRKYLHITNSNRENR